MRREATDKISPINGSPHLLYVDLDGTLVETDTLAESLILFFKKKPFHCILFFFWLCKGRAYLKQKIAHHCTPAPHLLPYNKELLSYLNQEKQNGRSIILATAAHYKIAKNISTHLGLFDDVLATSGLTNLKGKHKLAAIKLHSQGNEFSYAGDSSADIPIWQEAKENIIVGSKDKIRKLSTDISTSNNLILFQKKENHFKQLLRAMRPHQWIKNILLFVPLILAHKFSDIDLIIKTCLAFAAFSACATAVYIINDLLDIEADRQHWQKKVRPIASGAFPISYAIICVPVCLTICAIISAKLTPEFQFILATYFLITTNYSMWLKKIVLLDVVTLSLLYTLRITAGSAAISIETTQWLLLFSLFIFLSLALGKRYSELHNIETSSENNIQPPRRGYRNEDIEQLAILGSASGYIAVLVLALYLNSSEIAHLYSQIEYMWFICPLFIYWISRFWLLARRGEMHEDPIIFTIHDRTSYIIGALIAFVLLCAMI